MRNAKNKEGALEKNVGHQFEFPRKYVKKENALSLTKASMEKTGCCISTQMKAKTYRKYVHMGMKKYQCQITQCIGLD